MLKVFEDRKSSYCNSKMFFDLQDCQISFSSKNVDLYVTSELKIIKNVDYKIRLILGIFHNYESQVREISRLLGKSSNTYYITNAVDRTIDHPNILFNDFLFNRTKAYYLNQNIIQGTDLWYYAGNDCYVLPEFNFKDIKSKVYLAVNDTYRGYLHARPVIMNYLSKHKDKGYLGDASNPEMFLPAEGNPNIYSKYYPAANIFYKDTYISIYGETIEYGNSWAITEKTFEPLIKGHFILPFSNKGFVAFLQSWGVKLPKFINYEYDTLADYKSRYSRYHEEMIRLVNMPIERWQEFYFDYRDIIKHNRQIFFDKPFHKIDIESLLAHISNDKNFNNKRV